MWGRSSDPSPYAPVETDDDSDNYTDDFIMREVKMQKDILREQDDNLDLLGGSISRMGEMALGIKSEIETQNKMIGDLEEDVDQAQNNIDLVTEKTKDLIKKSGGLK
mmetsp:Transcript_67155/g.135345  ORF Transcript_67155/g.135345 Transcript_67155/m.135345 type:complete len:107 (-) Transcript_67155:13-333(-)